jgi:nucleoid-associated protein YgaU
MDIWVKGHLHFLTAAVGPSDVPLLPAAASKVAKTVGVFPGLTLSDLANAEYGDWQLWPLLYDRNKSEIGANPNMLKIGHKLVVEPLANFSAAQLTNARKRAASWKTVK